MEVKEEPGCFSFVNLPSIESCLIKTNSSSFSSLFIKEEIIEDEEDGFENSNTETKDEPEAKSTKRNYHFTPNVSLKVKTLLRNSLQSDIKSHARKMNYKRKKVVVTIEQKLKAIKRLDSGESIASIAKELGVGKSTVCDWKKHKAEIVKWCATQASPSGIKKRKSRKTGKHREVEEALFYWYQQMQESGVPVIGRMLQEKALEFKMEIEGESPEFLASDGWLDRWKKRFGIPQASITVDPPLNDSVLESKQYLLDLIRKEGISEEQLYSFGKTGLNLKVLPKKALEVRKEATDFHFNDSKNQVTILACSNATGKHKLRLTLMGEPKKPSVFNSFKSSVDQLPINYIHQKNTCMNEKIFLTWFENEFVPSVESHLESIKMPRKALLLLENAPYCPAACELTNGDIRAVFLPANNNDTRPLMNRGTLELLKKRYRKLFVTSLVNSTDNNDNYITALQEVDILDMAMWLSESWDEIDSKSLARTWGQLVDCEDVTESVETSKLDGELASLLKKLPGCDEISEEDINEWMKTVTEAEVVDSDLFQMVTQGERDDVHMVPEPNNDISHAEGLKCIEAALEYISQQEEVELADIICLQKWKNIAARKRTSNTR